MGAIKVSVVIAVYNSEKYLRQTMDSILKQTLREIEVVCVDDGSDDASLQILREYAHKDKRVRVLENREVSDGAGAARNLGISHAVGEYLSVLDADDFFEPDLLEKAYGKAISTQADVVLYDSYIYDEWLERDNSVAWILAEAYLPNVEVFAPQDYAGSLFQMTLGAAWNMMVSRSLVEKYRIRFEAIHHADDLGFVYLCFACAGRIVLLRERLMHYRRNNEESQYSKISQWPLAGCEALCRLRQELESRNLYGIYRVGFVNRALDYIAFYLEEMTEPSAFETLYEALKREYLEKLDLFGIADEQISNQHTLNLRNQIQESSSCAYWMRKYQAYFKGHDDSFLFQSVLPQTLPEGASVAIYGAGIRGWRIFCALMEGKKHPVRAWVDKNFAQIGYPVQSPEVLRNTKFDCILITMKSRDSLQEAKLFLADMGIEVGKIYWMPLEWDRCAAS